MGYEARVAGDTVSNQFSQAKARPQPLANASAAAAFPKLMSQGEYIRTTPSKTSLTAQTIAGLQGRIKALRQLSAQTPRVDAALDLQSTSLSIRNLHEHGDLYLRYLRARRDVFILQKGWQLPETDGMEFDQYDTPLARWIVVHNNKDILGGIRLLPTTSKCGNHTYMLRDAQRGLLSGLPPDVLYEPAPVTDKVWEATRLFVSDIVPSEQRLKVQKVLMLEMVATARSVGANDVIGIVPAIFKRWLMRIGMTAKAAGPIKTIDGDKVQAALMSVA